MNPMFLTTTILFYSHQKFLSYFVEKKAFSPETAINIDELLGKMSIKKERLSKLNYLKVTSDNKYWFDKDEYTKLSKETLYLILIMLITLAIIIGSAIYYSKMFL